jgi:hypothetical protein
VLRSKDKHAQARNTHLQRPATGLAHQIMQWSIDPSIDPYSQNDNSRGKKVSSSAYSDGKDRASRFSKGEYFNMNEEELKGAAFGLGDGVDDSASLVSEASPAGAFPCLHWRSLAVGSARISKQQLRGVGNELIAWVRLWPWESSTRGWMMREDENELIVWVKLWSWKSSR